jgi:hypothetical protein
MAVSSSPSDDPDVSDQDRHERRAEEQLAAEQADAREDREGVRDGDRRMRATDREASDYLREKDAGSTAAQRGYSHGQLPGSRLGDVHFDDWNRVATPPDGQLGGVGDLSADERDEERRAEGALADQRFEGETPARVKVRSLNPRDWTSGWSSEAQAAYFLGKRHSGVWNDQAWTRYLEQKKRTLPPPAPCPICDEVFQPERANRVYCSEKCSRTAKMRRYRARKAA